MSRNIEISFSRSARHADGLAVLLAAEGAKIEEAAAAVDQGGVLEKAIRVSDFKGKAMATLDIVAPAGASADRMLLVGIGDPKAAIEDSWVRLGGQIYSQFRKAARV